MSKCFIVSNRLPLTFNSARNEFSPSSGGLVSALKGISSESIGFDFEWLGLLTNDIPQEKINQLKDLKSGKIKLCPITVDKKRYDLYYNKYCNNVLWPLFHYERSLVHYTPNAWDAYFDINQAVAETILNIASPKDLIWIHDFHLLLVPGLIKKKRPELKVGFFLHIPFPSSEIFREIPERDEIMNSLVTCDLIGFHDLSYLNHYKNSIARILGRNIDDSLNKKWGVYPISIDTQHFIDLANHVTTLDFFEKYSEAKNKHVWILGVDRLDYIKGLIQKLKTFKEFLRKNPEFLGKIQLIQVVIPSRTDVHDYQLLKNKIEQFVSSINGEFGNPTYSPIQYLYHSVSDYELSALYQLSEILYVGSSRDGMNLVSLEYVASQPKNKEGAVLLSEFAGAHSTLSHAFSINPWNIEDSCSKILAALRTPQEKLSSSMNEMKNFLKKYTSSDWAELFLSDLKKVNITDHSLSISTVDFTHFLEHIKDKKTLIFCDLDGTLAPIEDHPNKVQLSLETIQILDSLSHLKNISFVVISGRDKNFLEKEFIKNNLNLTIAACHGAYFYSRKTKSWNCLNLDSDNLWREGVLDILNLYTKRTPESFIEDKTFSIAWHYRNSPDSFADFLANKLFTELEEHLISSPAHVLKGKKVIEVKSIFANKGHFINFWLNEINPDETPDLIIAIGDDTTDEDMFRVIQAKNNLSNYCIKIGEGHTIANYFLKDQISVNPFLAKIISNYKEV